MLKRKLGLAVAAILCVGLMTSCFNIIDNRGNGGDDEVVNGIDYKDYSKSSYSIKVYNESSKNVVCFQNTPRESNLISGVKAGATVGLKKNSLFDSTHDFILFVVTEEDYLANKNDLSKLDNHPFASLYAYYNSESVEATANMVYHISKKMGGEYYILINNNTNYNVELRQNGLYGESLAFAGHNTIQTKINMTDGDYYCYPVFRKYSKSFGEIITTYPKFTSLTDGKDYPVAFGFSLDSDNFSKEFDVKAWLDENAINASEAARAAYISIHNGNTSTGISLYKGGTNEAEITTTGGKMINPGKTLKFEVPMIDLGNGNYNKKVTISGWQIGTPMGGKINPPLETIEVEAGKMYYLEITGPNYIDVTATWKKDNGVLVADQTHFEDEPVTEFR